MEKLYAYVDESGQDTEGAFFLVAVIVVGKERDEMLRWLEEVERETGKGLRSWHRSRRRERLAYIDRVLGDPRLRRSMFYAHYAHTRAYRDLTLLTIAKALGERMGGKKYKATVIIDGLARTDTRAVAVGLRRIRIPIRKVRGGRDESNALLRLADAMAGFLRAAQERDPMWQERRERARGRGLITKV
jgi:hypothetical protein